MAVLPKKNRLIQTIFRGRAHGSNVSRSVKTQFLLHLLPVFRIFEEMKTNLYC